MGHLIGYARVSTADQDLQLQIEALQRAGCHDAWIFRDIASGARTARPGLEACVHALASGDTLVVWRLDRLGRSMVHLVTVIEELLRRQVGFRSLCDGAIDTTTASGELVFHIFSALAQFERRLIQERTRAGLAAARARGTHGGRRPLRPDNPRVRMASMMYGDQHLTVPEICRTLRISPATFYRYVALGRRAADRASCKGGQSGGRMSFEN
jgi:DNA invertase Pin-like site-specific DNA recombinase